MATGIIRNFFTQAPTPAYFPTIFQHSHSQQDEEQSLEGKPEEQEEREEEEEEEEEDDEESEVQEEEEEEEEEEEGECFLSHPHHVLDVTKQLLRFADLISRDIQRYFGRGSGDQEACDIYSDSIAVTPSGRLRYYDDLLRIARSGSPGDREGRAPTCTGAQEVTAAKGNSGLGPLAELFDHRGPSQGRGQPMIKRHLPLSFWSEPTPCCSLDAFSAPAGASHTDGDTHADSNTHCGLHTHHSAHAIDGTQPDFSDLLANWDPNPELTHTLTENTHI